MTIVEFHQAAMEALSGDPNNIVLKDLTKQAHELADMVGWADSIIDKEYKVSDAFTVLKDRARVKYESTSNKHVAILHDAVNDLLSEIYRHDNDLTPSTFDDNDDST
jgi:hypothetical protein